MEFQNICNEMAAPFLLRHPVDIAQRQCKFIGQYNNILRWFGKNRKLDCSTAVMSYCFDFYGCELWDLANVEIQSRTSWRQALRRTWKLPYYCHTSILHIFFLMCAFN